jgi:hypothetical protein
MEFRLYGVGFQEQWKLCCLHIGESSAIVVGLQEAQMLTRGVCYEAFRLHHAPACHLLWHAARQGGMGLKQGLR